MAGPGDAVIRRRKPTRLPSTGSVSTRVPPRSSSTVAWPRRVTQTPPSPPMDILLSRWSPGRPVPVPSGADEARPGRAAEPGGMTTKAAFTPEEWTSVLEGPPSAGMIVVMAGHGGMFRETIAMSKAYVEARGQHGQSELLDEIVAAKPKADHTRYHSYDELRDNGLRHVRT